jgi:hypothetical protein
MRSASARESSWQGRCGTTAAGATSCGEPARVPVGLVAVRADEETRYVQAAKALAGSGNAIVPQVAAAFIEAAFDAMTPPTQDRRWT